MRKENQPTRIKYNPDAWPACWILQLIANNRLEEFYNSGLWKRTRREVIRKAKRRCYDCERESPAVLEPIKKGATVHHVNELRQRPDLALSEYDESGKVNLICLCPACHWKRHHKSVKEITPERW